MIMRKRIIAMTVLLSMLCAMLSGCKRLEATTMRILGFEGKVVLEENGKNKKIKENIRLNSGNELLTSYFSTATIGLDDAKIVSMDQKSEAEFIQSGKKLEMNLIMGSIFFVVKEPLKDDETFDIKTSTMMVGIRGTSGYVEVNDDGTERLIVTDGVVHVTYTNPETGEVSEEDVSAGQEFRVYPTEAGTDDNDDQNGGYSGGGYLYSGSGYGIMGVTSNEFPDFARNYILENEDVKEKISADIGDEELDEILWDDEIGYSLSPNSYGSYEDLEGVINALEQLEMVFRIAAYTLNRDAQGLEQYLESKNIPGAEYITEFGLRMLDTMR